MCDAPPLSQMRIVDCACGRAAGAAKEGKLKPQNDKPLAARNVRRVRIALVMGCEWGMAGSWCACKYLGGFGEEIKSGNNHSATEVTEKDLKNGSVVYSDANDFPFLCELCDLCGYSCYFCTVIGKSASSSFTGA